MIKNTSIILLFNIIFLSGTVSAATVQEVENAATPAPASDTEAVIQQKKETASGEASSAAAEPAKGEADSAADNGSDTSADAAAIDRAKEEAAREMAVRVKMAQREAAREMAASVRAALREAARDMAERVRAVQEEANLVWRTINEILAPAFQDLWCLKAGRHQLPPQTEEILFPPTAHFVICKLPLQIRKE